jgi:hypothetical protein
MRLDVLTMKPYKGFTTRHMHKATNNHIEGMGLAAPAARLRLFITI